MHIIKATCTDNRLFKLTKEDQLIGQLNYRSLFSTKALLQTSPTEAYLAKSIGVLQSRIGIFKDKEEIASLHMQGTTALRIRFHETKQEFFFKTKGTLKSKYHLENEKNEILMEFEPSFAWKNFKYSYTISSEKENDVLLVLIGLYGANYFINLMSGVTAPTFM